MAVVSVSELLVLSSSVSVPVTVAVLLSVPVAVAPTLTLMVMVAVAPLAMLPKLAVTVPLAWLTLPCDAVALVKVKPAGRMSVTTTLVAPDGPSFTTVSV